MDELLELLEDIKPTVDFRTCTGLIDDGYLDSFDILSIVSELNDAFGIEISPGGHYSREFQLCPGPLGHGRAP